MVTPQTRNAEWYHTENQKKQQATVPKLTKEISALGRSTIDFFHAKGGIMTHITNRLLSYATSQHWVGGAEGGVS